MNNNDEKILTLNLNGKKGVNILKSRYDVMKEAIVSISTREKQITLVDLGKQVETELGGTFDGKIGWYLMAVKLDLEARGIITKVPGKTPQTLRIK
jgi:hypothetical protein